MLSAALAPHSVQREKAPTIDRAVAVKPEDAVSACAQ